MASVPDTRRRRRSSAAVREAIEWYLAISPWLIGFIVFTGGPILFSLYMSFTYWDLTNTPRWEGFQNYLDLGSDPRFWQSLKVTLTYSVLALPLGLLTGLGLSLLLNLRLPGMNFFRTLFYIPSVIAGVAVAAIWMWTLNGQFGLLNYLLSFIGITGPDWLGDPNFALYALVLISLWGVGGGAVIYLAGLQNIPAQLYEAAAIDGAGLLARFRSITLPLLSPTIFFLLVTGIIASFQTFTTVYILSGVNRDQPIGSPEDSTLFYLLYLYQQAFASSKFGYAAAMAWVGALISLALALVVFKSQGRWVYYESERGGPNEKGA
ncbi:MAG: carbohydrate ABC transporter permease [Chloroflexota bacterium]